MGAADDRRGGLGVNGRWRGITLWWSRSEGTRVVAAKSLRLPRRYVARGGTPALTDVDPTIFTRRYYTYCLECTFCHDHCCTHGVDVDFDTARRIEARADDLERYLGVPRRRWFRSGVEADLEFPGGGARRTRVANGRCVFHNRGGRGCRLHTYCIERGLDHHELKSIVDCLFPLTFGEGVLCPAVEAEDGTLACLNTGPTLYRGARQEVEYYFGAGLVEALDDLEMDVLKEGK